MINGISVCLHPHPPEVNVRSTTTASDSVTVWLSQYLVVNYMLGTLQALVHIL